MLQLAILRHAKSSWDHPGADDFDRPLNARGEAAAPVMGAKLASLGFSPDLILCSPARRTRQTFEHIKAKFTNPDWHVKFDDTMYLANASDLADIVRNRGGEARKLLLIGHNPGVHALATMLTGSGDASSLATMAEKFPTAALAVLSFDSAQWRDIKPGTGRLETFTTPKLVA
jgi:phosphohistidine phosphatase